MSHLKEWVHRLGERLSGFGAQRRMRRLTKMGLRLQGTPTDHVMWDDEEPPEWAKRIVDPDTGAARASRLRATRLGPA